LNIAADTCLSELTGRGLLPAGRRAVYLSGSLVRGWGNDTSDLDVYVITVHPWRGERTASTPVSAEPGSVPVNAFYVGSRRLDVEYWIDSQVDSLLDSLSWAAFDSGKDGAEALTATETSFIQRLSYSQPLEGEEWIRRRRQQFDRSAVRTIVTNRALFELDHLTEDAVGMRSNGDLDSAVLAARLAFDRAVDALLASHGEIEGQPKWRARRMRAVAPPGLSFDEYWQLQTMQSFQNDAPERWVEEALQACQRIADTIQL
jgi:hypothetical protein